MNHETIIALVLPAATMGTAVMARALPWPEAWKRRKPLACPACMSGWSGFAVLAGAAKVGQLDAVLSLPASDAGLVLAGLWLALVGVSAPVFAFVNPPAVELPGME